ncbi:putative gustatory receptor 28a isoform X2 [Chelonus insularis]|uniref:putative gustatory receptor 28a isoform X2 n=1 Tax=Chelonus insularis TaxID=460826 RepID=UPI00158F29AA|nr:putative gustatory receptor 28a isoform X2 [Chelonus insularis]
MQPSKFSINTAFLLYFYSFFFKVFGLFPWKITLFSISHTKATDPDNQAAKKSYYKHFYNIFLIVSFTSLHINFYIEVQKTTDETGTTTVVRRCLIFYGIITTLIILIYFVVRHKIISKAVNQLTKIDQVLNACNNYILVDNLGIHYLLFINLLTCFSATMLQLATRPLIVFFTWSIPAVLCNWVLTQYSLVLHIIINRLKSINKFLLKLNRISIDLESKSILFVKLPIIESIDTEITNIKCAYIELYSVCLQIANFYTFPTLLAIIFLCSLSLYFCYFVIITHYELVPFSMPERIMQIVWNIVVYYILIILSTYVNIFTNEKKRTVDIIHWILNTHRLDKKTEKKLKEFSQHLLHENIPFKVYDLMILDGSLLYAIISTAISYLIILIQFRFYNDEHT